MPAITFPPYQPRIRDQGGKHQVFDEIRRRWVVLTPEEWVRQNMLQYLVQVLNYPASSMAIEKEIRLGELKKRVDILLYDNNGLPFLLIECKAMEVALTEAVLQQVLRYNMALPVPYLAISNGHYTYLFERKEGCLNDIQVWPERRSQ